MQIAILDNAHNRVIIGRVPAYLADTGRSNDDIVEAIFSALGLTFTSSEYMLGNFEVVLADHNADTGRPNERGIELLTQDFKRDALQALKDSQD